MLNDPGSLTNQVYQAIPNFCLIQHDVVKMQGVTARELLSIESESIASSQWCTKEFANHYALSWSYFYTLEYRGSSESKTRTSKHWQVQRLSCCRIYHLTNRASTQPKSLKAHLPPFSHSPFLKSRKVQSQYSLE